MGRERREFTPEYKDEAVKLVINTGRSVAVVARELGVKEQTGWLVDVTLVWRANLVGRNICNVR